MNNTIYFTVLSFFYSLLLIYILIKKRKKLYKDNKTFYLLAITNFIGIIVESMLWISIKKLGTHSIILIVLSRLFLIYLLAWISLLSTYIFDLSISNSNQKKVKVIMIILFLVFSIIDIFLPLYYNTNPVYSYGPSTKIIYYISEVYITICFLSMIANKNHFNTQKYSPLFVYITGGVLAMLVQSVYPGCLVMTAMETFVTFITYFTINKDEVDTKINKSLNERSK